MAKSSSTKSTSTLSVKTNNDREREHFISVYGIFQFLRELTIIFMLVFIIYYVWTINKNVNLIPKPAVN